MSSGTDRFASIESRIEIVMKMIVYNTILGITPSENPKNRPNKLPKVTLCIFVTSKLYRNYIIKKVKFFLVDIGDFFERG